MGDRTRRILFFVAVVIVSIAWVLRSQWGNQVDSRAEIPSDVAETQHPLPESTPNDTDSGVAPQSPVAEFPSLQVNDATEEPPEMPNLVDALLFFPTTYPDGNWEPRGLEFEDAWFEAPDGSKLHGWYCPVRDARGTLFFAHGNGGNLSHRAEFVARLQTRLGWNVFLFDYRGYGRSAGKPSSQGVIEDGEAALAWLLRRTDLTTGSVIFLGRSLGGAVAAHLAAEHGGKALILESAFVSLREVGAVHYPPAMVSLLVPDHLKTGDSVAEFHGPIIIAHGDADTVIPFAHGTELAKRAPGPKLFVRFPGAEHNEPPPEWYYDRVEQFLIEQFKE